MKSKEEMPRRNETFSHTGFTLIELLIVMSIIGILVTLGVISYRTVQMRARDAQRKSELSQLSKALEVFYSDHNFYPKDNAGKIMSCPFSTGTCDWGVGAFKDTNSIYFATLPKDPVSTQYYVYRTVVNSNSQKYQLFAALENPKDLSCLGGDCEHPPITISCGSKICNFAITSPNTTYSEQ